MAADVLRRRDQQDLFPFTVVGQVGQEGLFGFGGGGEGEGGKQLQVGLGKWQGSDLGNGVG